MFAKIPSVLASAALIASTAAPAHALRSSRGMSTQGMSLQGTVIGSTGFAIEGIDLPAAAR